VIEIVPPAVDTELNPEGRARRGNFRGGARRSDVRRRGDEGPCPRRWRDRLRNQRINAQRLAGGTRRSLRADEQPLV